MKKTIKLMVEAKWDEIEKARKKSSQFLASHGLPYDNVQAFTMVVSELIENSMKYGTFAPSKNNVVVDISIDDNVVTAEVVNPVDKSVYNHLKELDRTIQWIRGHQDPFEAYVERLREVSKKPLNDEESGLGLTRIAYEGKAIVDFFLSDENLLNVSAVTYS